MNRRKSIKVAAGAFAGTGIGLVTLSTAFKPEIQPVSEPSKIEYDQSKETIWQYIPLDPAAFKFRFVPRIKYKLEQSSSSFCF